MSASPGTYTALVADKPDCTPAFTHLPTHPSPLPPHHLRVHVAYASLNPMDGKIAREGNIMAVPEPVVIGFDYSGTVTESTSSDFQPGDQVFGMSTHGGCMATELVVPAMQALHLKHATMAEASTLGIAYTSAALPLEIVADISKRAGQTIFIAGATGGVGWFAVQIALSYGMKVIASGSKPEALAKLRDMQSQHKPGQLEIVNRTEDVHQRVKQLTNNHGSDVVYDPTYIDASMAQSAGVVAQGGIWMRLGPWEHSATQTAEARKVAANRGATATFGHLGHYWYEPVYTAKFGEVMRLLEKGDKLIGDGKLTVIISQTVPFKDGVLQPAVFDNADGKQMFKVVVNVGGQ